MKKLLIVLVLGLAMVGCENSRQTRGALIGGAGGALIGNAIGHGTTGTLVGAAAGAAVGSAVAK